MGGNDHHLICNVIACISDNHWVCFKWLEDFLNQFYALAWISWNGLLCEYEVLCSISCTLDLIVSVLLVFRWSGGAVRSSPVAQGLQHRLCWLRKRHDSWRGGTTSGWGRLKQSQNITLFCQIVWHHVSPNIMSTAVIIVLFFCILSFAFYIGKITLF